MKSFKVFTAVAALALVAVGAQAGPLADATADQFWGIELGGYVDVSFTYNTNDPDKRQDGNILRTFDDDHNDFNLNAFQFYMDRLPEEVGESGFRVDALIGEDAEELVAGSDIFGEGAGPDDNSDDLFGDDDFVLYQAYVSYIVPLGNGITIDAGRFSTWHGFEAIESPANNNFSRSLLFTLSQPFTHTGVRLSYPFNDQIEVSAGVTQGWDVVEDNNDAKTFHGAVWWTPTETLFIGNSVAAGPEQDDSLEGTNSDYRFLYDLVAEYNLADFNLEQLTVGTNFNWGSEQDVDGLSPDGSQEDAEWWGAAGYVRYDINERIYLAMRGEYFDDEDGSRISDLGFEDVTVKGTELWEVTATLGYNLTDNMQTRLEYRHDDADDDIFYDKDEGDDTQDTISFEVIYSF